MTIEQELLRYKLALETIAQYDRNSQYGEGICDYGCDCPMIAQKALRADKNRDNFKPADKEIK